MGLFDGRRGLVVGVANARSLATSIEMSNVSPTDAVSHARHQSCGQTVPT